MYDARTFNFLFLFSLYYEECFIIGMIIILYYIDTLLIIIFSLDV